MKTEGGRTLSSLISISIKDFITIAIETTKALRHLHNQYIIHRDLNTSTIFYHEAENLVTILESQLSVQVSKLQPYVVPSNKPVGSWGFLPPEQTGRVNLVTDFRSDLYSIGITFYKLLTGKMPFESDDPSVVVHSHLAVNPIPPHQISPNIPIIISHIIMKLIEKEPKSRYQTTDGLLFDLGKCFESDPNKLDFALGLRDKNKRFELSHKLYGRNKEVNYIQGMIARVANTGNKQVLLVTGGAGKGKTSIIKEAIYRSEYCRHSFLRDTLIEKGGVDISGKFDQYKNSPYSAIMGAFHLLTQYLITLPNDDFLFWKKRIQEVLNGQGQILTQHLPLLKVMLGVQPDLDPLSPIEAEIRFNSLFCRFIQIFTGPLRPIVLFLDDLQWADERSLNLLKYLMTFPDLKYFAVIAAYRDSEVDGSHILNPFLKELLVSDGEIIQMIHLAEIQPDDVLNMIIDSLDGDNLNEYQEDIALLTKLVVKKTACNPFFVNQFLYSLYSKELLHYDIDKSRWVWDLKNIEQQNITENVVELLVHAIQQLPREAQDVVKIASMLGHVFTLEILKEVMEKSVDKLISKLVLEGIVVQMIEEIVNKLVIEGLIVQVESRKFRFLHDKVQQAAVSMIEENEIPKLHLAIARVLYKRRSTEDGLVFDTINHFLGASSLLNLVDIFSAADAAISAAKKSKQLTAFKDGLEILIHTAKLVPDSGWSSHYDITFNLYFQLLEFHFLCNNSEEAKEIFRNNIDKVKSPLEKASMFKIVIQIAFKESNFLESLTLGEEALSILGINLNGFDTNCTKELFNEVTSIIVSTPLERIDHFNPDYPTKDPRIIEAESILQILVAPSFILEGNYFKTIICTSAKNVLTYGYCPYTPITLIWQGIISMYFSEKIDLGYSISSLGWQQARSQSSVIRGMAGWMFTTFVAPIRTPFIECEKIMRDSYKSSIDGYDFIYATYATVQIIGLSLLNSTSLKSIINEAVTFFTFVERVKIEDIKNLITAVASSIMYLSGTNKSIEGLKYVWNNADWESNCIINSTKPNKAFYFSFRAIANYIMGEYRDSLLATEIMIENGTVWNNNGIYYGVYNQFIQFASITALYSDFSEKDKEKYSNQMSYLYSQMEIFAKNSFENYNALYLMMRGEKFRINRNYYEAIDTIEMAVEHSQKYQSALQCAIANELLAKCYLQLGKKRLAQVYMKDAIDCYILLDAHNKVDQLRTGLQYLPSPPPSNLTQKNISFYTMESITSSMRNSNEGYLDVLAAVRASQALSEEINFDDMVKKLMDIIITSAGAQRCVLLLYQNDQLFVEAEAVAFENEHNLLSIHKPLKEYSNIATVIVNYVERTGEIAVMRDAGIDNELFEDPYLKGSPVRSILCLPVRNKGNKTGVLYVENNLLSNAFTMDNVYMLSHFSTSIAISIENSLLYRKTVEKTNELEELNEASKRFLPDKFLSLLQKGSVTNIQLGDSTQIECMSVLFCDIRRFSSLTEFMSPKESFDFLNGYLKYIGPALHSNGGFIDKFIGDAVMALFPFIPDDAVKAGIEMQRALVNFNKHKEEYGLKNILDIGIGIHTGPVMLGTVGVEERMQPTVISDTVNLASRLEGLNRVLGPTVIISENTYKLLNDPSAFHIRRLGYVRVSGKTTPVQIFDVFDGHPEELVHLFEDTRITFESALDLLQQKQFNQAESLFRLVLEKNPRDPATIFMLEVCDRVSRKDNWDGILCIEKE